MGQQMVWQVLSAICFVAAISLDAALASFAYGADEICIPVLSNLIISGTCTVALGASLALGSFVRPFLPDGVASWGSCFILVVLGVIKCCDSALKGRIRRGKPIKRELRFSILSLHLILRVYADPEEADADRSKTLTVAEAFSLAMALSLDGLAAGFGAALGETPILLVVLFSFLFGTLSVALGSFLGRKISEKLSFPFSGLSGAVLILLGISRLF